jgi:hypothetical protein
MSKDRKGIVHVSTTCMGWDPETGENKVFDTPAAREAEGWLDHHPSDEEKGGAGKAPGATRDQDDPADAPLTREELITALKEGGVNFKETATDAQLDSALRGALRKALTARKVEFTGKDSTRALLAKLKASLAAT